MRQAVAASAVAIVNGRAHVICGLPGLGTHDASRDAKTYASLGVDSLLVSPPYGFPLSPAELEAHFAAVAEAAASVPLVAYNLPSRTHVSLDATILKRLAENNYIRGLKDSSNDLAAERASRRATQGLSADFRHYSGSETNLDALLLSGIDGMVPGLSNVFWPFHIALRDRAREGNWESVGGLQHAIVQLSRIYEAPFPASSLSARAIAVLKEALRQRGILETSAMVTPFAQVDADTERYVRHVLSEADRLEASLL
jgi:4-hydroxy-tetrahydrodipicolinate synthase